MIKNYTLADGVSIVKIRKARKTYQCQCEPFAHDTTIRPGDLYARVKVTPGWGAGWHDMTFHIECVNPQ